MTKQTQTTAATIKLVTEPVVLDSNTDLASLLSQQKAIAAQIKEARANQPKRNTLQAEIDKQETSPNQNLKWLMWSMVRNRTQRGQSFEEAKDQVLAICANLIDRAYGKDKWNDVRNQKPATGRVC
ncbi:MAG: hypothetical protein ACLQUY_15080 [Ktedonobacterales bacterium]